MDTITYNGKQYPIKFGYYAMKHTSKDIGQELSKLEDVIKDLDNFEIFVYYGLQKGAMSMHKDLDLKKGDIESLMEDCFEDITKILNQDLADGKKKQPPQQQPKKAKKG